MNDTIYTTEQIKSILFPIFQTYNVQSAVLFGSYAKGTPQKNEKYIIKIGSTAAYFYYVLHFPQKP